MGEQKVKLVVDTPNKIVCCCIEHIDIDTQLETVDTQLETVDTQLETVDTQLETVDTQLETGNTQKL